MTRTISLSIDKSAGQLQGQLKVQQEGKPKRHAVTAFQLRRKHAGGFVLMVSLIMVIAITGIAVSLLSTATMDMKMAVAAEDREMATHAARGGNDQLYANAVNRTIANRNYFAAFATTQQATTFGSSTGATSSVAWKSENHVETDCPRSKSPTEGLLCVYLEANTTKNFGPNNVNQINVVSGIAQQVGVK